MNNFLLFIFNIFINSFLMFFTVAALIEITIFLFRIRQGRFAAVLRMLPILKLPFDLFMYDFDRWSYLNGVDPLSAEEGSRMLTIMLGWPSRVFDVFYFPFSAIQMTVNHHLTFTVADIISHSIPTFVVIFICITVVCGSIFFFSKWIFQYVRFCLVLKSCNIHEPDKIQNLSIHAFLKNHESKIVTSSLNGSPFVAGLFSSKIYMPENLGNSLSGPEYEAVVAHEIEHIRCKDNIIRFVLILIRSVFWWIPAKWLQKRIEEGQEIGCDARCQNYGIDPLNLASAIYKSAKYSQNTFSECFAPHLSKHVISKRTHLLLKDSSIEFGRREKIFCLIAASVALFIIFLGRFWIF